MQPFTRIILYIAALIATHAVSSGSSPLARSEPVYNDPTSDETLPVIERTRSVQADGERRNSRATIRRAQIQVDTRGDTQSLGSTTNRAAASLDSKKTEATGGSSNIVVRSHQYAAGLATSTDLSKVSAPAINEAPSLPYRNNVPHLGKLPVPRVYIYGVPEELHERLVRDRFAFGEAALLHNEGLPSWFMAGAAWTNSLVGLQRCLAEAYPRESFNTSDAADFFYVPFYPMYCHSAHVSTDEVWTGRDDIIRACQDFTALLTEVAGLGAHEVAARAAREPAFRQRLREVGLGELPRLWRRAGGRDHVFPGWFPMSTPYTAEDQLSDGPIRLLSDFSVIREPMFQVQDSDYMRRIGYDQRKDMVIPLHFLQAPVELPGIEHRRSKLLFYAASLHTQAMESNLHRRMLALLIRNRSDSEFVEIGDSLWNRPAYNPTSMKDSVFCPATPGDMQLTPRHTDALLHGCIPVVITEGHVPLPFDNILDWSAFAVLLPVSSLHDGTFLPTLEAMSAERVAELQRAVYAVRPYFFVTPEICRVGPSGRGASGLDLFLHQLALQQRDMQTLQRNEELPCVFAFTRDIVAIGRALLVVDPLTVCHLACFALVVGIAALSNLLGSTTKATGKR